MAVSLQAARISRTMAMQSRTTVSSSSSLAHLQLGRAFHLSSHKKFVQLTGGLLARSRAFGDVYLKEFQTTTTSVTVSFGRHRCPPTPGYRRRKSAQALRRRKVGRARAAQEDESTSQETTATSSPPTPSPPVNDKKAAAKAEIQKGQTTAIITGVISVMLGVGYLVLLQLLDTRGVNLVPPPPEAFDP